MGMRITFSDDPAWVLKEASEFLDSEPVLHNIILTLLQTRVAYPDPGRYWLVMRGAAVAGLVFQSPLHYAATLTPMEPDAVTAVVDRIAHDGVSLPGINGDAATASRFAGQWTEHSKSGAFPVQGLRLYEAREVLEWPEAGGQRRNAVTQDRGLVIEWVRAFHAEVGEPLSGPEVLVDRWLNAGQLWIWDDHGPASMIVSTDPVAGVVRVRAVYTPPEKRKRGYAGACVGDFSREILSNGLRPILYTDLGNPASNSLYRGLGYRAVAEILRYRFE